MAVRLSKQGDYDFIVWVIIKLHRPEAGLTICDANERYGLTDQDALCFEVLHDCRATAPIYAWVRLRQDNGDTIQRRNCRKTKLNHEYS